MPYSNPITISELSDITFSNPLHPRDGSPDEVYMPQAYFMVPPATTSGPVRWRLFDAAYISTGIIDPNRLGTGSTGAGNLYLADDGTWKPVSGGATTLDGLTDVTISAPANAQVLTYNSTTSQWENQTPSGGGGGGDMNKSTYDVDNDGVVDSAETTQIIVRNSTGSTLTKGQVVYLSGATGNRPNAVLSQANTEATSSKTIGIVVANISNNSDGYVAVSGTLHNLDTSAFTAGNAVWLSATVAGAYTSTIPVEPNHTVFIGYVARSHPTQGRLVILIQNGYELNELHGVLVTSEANNDLLTYESSTGLWKNKTFSAIFGGTPLVSVPTLDQVTTAGNTTTNAITVGGLVVDTNTLVVDSVNNSVGIGTTSPLAKLHIATNTGGTNTVLRLSVAPSSANVIHFRDTDGTSQGAFLATGSTFSYGTYQAAQVNLAGGLGGIGLRTNNGNAHIRFYSGNADEDFSPEIARFVASTGNLLLNTTTDAGQKLQVSGKVFIKGTTSLTATKVFEVQNGAGESIMDFRDSTYAFFGCGQGGGSATGFIFNYSNTSYCQFSGYNYGAGAGAYKPILLDTDIVGRGNGVFVNFGVSTNPPPDSDTEFGVRGRTADTTSFIARFRNSSNTDMFEIRADGALFTNTLQGYSGTLSIPGNPPGSTTITITNGLITNIA